MNAQRGASGDGEGRRRVDDDHVELLLRPAGERIAQHGYFVLLPDLFYRSGPYEAPAPAKLFGDAEFRQAWVAKYIASATIGGIGMTRRTTVNTMAKK